MKPEYFAKNNIVSLKTNYNNITYIHVIYNVGVILQ